MISVQNITAPSLTTVSRISGADQARGVGICFIAISMVWLLNRIEMVVDAYKRRGNRCVMFC
jgi:hypothetical protein